MVKRFIMILSAFISTTALAGRSWSEIKQSGVVKIANDGEFPPFYEGVTGKMEGFEIDLGNEIFQRLGVKVSWVKDDFNTLLGNMNNGKYDAVRGCLKLKNR